MGASFPVLMMQTPIGYGYINGGYISASYTKTLVCSKLNFNVLSMGNIAATLADIPSASFGFIAFPTGASSKNAGYMFGAGSSGSVVSKLTFSTEAMSTSTPGGTISCGGGCGFQSSSRGFRAGGITGGASADSATIGQVTFANDTYADTTKTLSAVRAEMAGISSETIGYMMGGRASGDSGVTLNETYTFSTNTRGATSAIPALRATACGSQSPTTGYAFGGFLTVSGSGFSNATATNLKMPFATETTAALSQSLSQTRGQACAVTSVSMTFIEGGITGRDGTYRNTGDAIAFVTETAYGIRADLAVARCGCVGVQTGGLGA